MRIFMSLIILVVSVLPTYSQAWKQPAHDSIMKYRTSPLSIGVVNAVGQPAESVNVHVKMLKHTFKWGTTVNVNEISRIIGNKGTFNINSPYINHFRLFNSVTPDNAGKWKGWIDPSQRATYLRTIDWLDSEGILNRGHTCVWESERFNAIPDILIGQTDTAVVRAEVKKHINNIMSTLSDKIYEMDVVNELIHEQHIVKGLLNAPVPALEHSQWYKWAKQAAPDVDLIANEFDLFQSGNTFYERYITYVQKMIDDGAPVDGVGMQGHFWTDMPAFEELQKRISQVKPLGLPMAVTEFDMKGKSYQDMERAMYAVFAEPQMYGFTIWGAWDGSQWRKNGPLFEENWEIKPSGQAWLDLVHEKWKTDTSMITDETGSLSLDAFKGTYVVELLLEDKVYVDTFIVGDEPVSLTYTTDSIYSAIPQATLEIQGENSEFNVYQPAVIQLNTGYPDSILKVEFYEGLFMQHRDKVPAFAYEIVNTYAGKKRIYAEVTCKNGYTFLTDTLELSFVNKNAFPVINEVYPNLNQVFIYGEDITVACIATDYENQMWKVELSGFSADSMLTDTAAPYTFTLTDLLPGNYSLQLKALDSLHGFNTRQLSFSVINPDAQNVSVSNPGAASDDVEQLEDGSIETEGDLDMGEKLTGIRFSSPKLPGGALVDSAFVQFTADNINTEDISIPIQAELLTGASGFSTASNNLSSRQALTSIILWSPPAWDSINERNSMQRTPDLKPLIDELVSLENWSESSPVNLILGLAEEASKRRAKSVDMDAAKAPQLSVYYRLNLEISAPEAPTGLRITSRSGNEITLNWNPVEGQDVFLYFIYINGVKYDLFGTKNTEYTLKLDDNETYEIYITAMNRYSLESAPGNKISSDDAISNIGIQVLDNDFIAFPNPFTEEIRITVKQQVGQNELSIFNINGQLVRVLEPATSSKQYAEYSWDGNDSTGGDLPPGVYFIKQGSLTKKLIKH